MVTNLTNATGWMARFVLSMAVLFCNGPRLVGPDAAHSAVADVSPADSGKANFHATLTVGRGKKQVTVRLEFGHAGDRNEDESL